MLNCCQRLRVSNTYQVRTVRDSVDLVHPMSVWAVYGFNDKWAGLACAQLPAARGSCGRGPFSAHVSPSAPALLPVCSTRSMLYRHFGPTIAQTSLEQHVVVVMLPMNTGSFVPMSRRSLARTRCRCASRQRLSDLIGFSMYLNETSLVRFIIHVPLIQFLNHIYTL